MTPQTEAGKRLLDGMDESQFALGDWASRLSEVEAEARRQLLDELRMKVEGSEQWSWTRAAVLALLEGRGEPTRNVR